MPRCSRISWKRRELAEPPSIESSSDAANLRRSDRETPSPPRHRCTCSVSLRWKTDRGAASPTHTGRTPTASSGSCDSGAKRVSIAWASGSCSRFPAADTTMFGPT